jgi:hypothetical protein
MPPLHLHAIFIFLTPRRDNSHLGGSGGKRARLKITIGMGKDRLDESTTLLASRTHDSNHLFLDGGTILFAAIHLFCK